MDIHRLKQNYQIHQRGVIETNTKCEYRCQVLLLGC